MLAVAARVHSESAFGTIQIIWHKPADPAACDDNCDYHALVCGEPGISSPSGIRDVPADLDEPGQRWCSTCLAISPDGTTPARA